MKRRRPGIWIISLVALFTILSPFLADWNETHIYNPRWPPHAKFHNAQTMMMGVVAGLLTLYFLWLRREGGAWENLKMGSLWAVLYWVTQAGGIFFPGTAFVDPEFAARNTFYIAGVKTNQLMMDTLILAFIGLAYYLEHRRINNAPQDDRGQEKFKAA